MKFVSLVYYCETCNRRDFVVKTLEIFKGRLENAKRIFVKPNIVSSEPYPTTTHPEVLDAVLNWLSGREVIVGDGPAVDAGSSDKVLWNTPLRQICENHNTRLVNLYSAPMKRIQSKRGYTLKVSTVPLSCDFVISVPLLKVHNICGMSCALKNQFGYLSRLDRMLMHMRLKDIQKGIAEVNAAVPTNLFIVDAIQTMVKAQECRHGGCPTELGVMIAGADPVSLDCYGLDILQKVEPEIKAKKSSMKYIDYASDYGVGTKDYEIKKI
ncbi:MAG: DUF362 domain-containing protein [Candidatus Bathyarchaeota archaeon]